ncbi:MAG: YggU family protein [Bdellovibrio sp.]|nr:YggU family protein [Bdellovibrio sp.]
MNFIKRSAAGVVLHIFATPKASKTEIAGLHGIPQRIKIRIAAPPVEGAANEELLRYLKKLLKVPARQLVIESGHSSKFKDVLCIGLLKRNLSNVGLSFQNVGSSSLFFVHPMDCSLKGAAGELNSDFHWELELILI